MAEGGLVAVAVLLAALLLWRAVRGRRAFGTVGERATYAALHQASMASPHLRAGLTAESAGRSARHLRALLGTPAVSLTDTEELLAWEGDGEVHTRSALRLAGQALTAGRPTVVSGLTCGDPDCPVRAVVVAPLVLDDRVVGTLGAYAPTASPGLVSAVAEVARWVSGQLELAELDESRSRLAEAQVRALRAQISPHFIFNALTAIASFVRTDPERARELLLDFADFTRYSSRAHGEYTTLAEELRSVDRYLLLEKARFGDRLHVVLRIAPEVLPVAVPFLCLQPLVENAVQHGLERGGGSGTVTVVAEDDGGQCRITVEDDGAGGDPEQVRRALAGTAPPSPGGHTSIGLGNVDARLRAAYGDDHGLVVETAIGAGTKVTVRVPKYSAGVRAS
ncbi:MAG TPA: histidine kinase [Mycobacteriales bacterium]|jgi:two-component system LytT family sensor kinase|nr:histidine kinase [Mycobacteriales bacterium]